MSVHHGNAAPGIALTGCAATSVAGQASLAKDAGFAKAVVAVAALLYLIDTCCSTGC